MAERIPSVTLSLRPKTPERFRFHRTTFVTFSVFSSPQTDLGNPHGPTLNSSQSDPIMTEQPERILRRKVG
jgi:hypothetical protein